jgi:hypothetical protein
LVTQEFNPTCWEQAEKHVPKKVFWSEQVVERTMQPAKKKSDDA